MTDLDDLEIITQNLERPIGDARGLPGAWYTDEAFARLEATRVFARTWICAGYAHELHQAGSAVPVDIAGFPILFTRNDEGEIKAWHNTCPHRGARLLDQPRHGKSIIQCRNHGWAFDMDGALRSTPHWGGFREHHRDGFDPGCHGLKPVRCEQWRQWLFVNLDGNAPPFSDYLAPFSKHFAEYNLDALVHNETIPLEIRGNWKIVEENFLEVLHLPLVHARLSRYAPFQEHDIVVDDLCIGTVIERGLPESWSPTPLPRFAAIPKTERKAKNLALFPNFKIVIGPDHCCTMVEFPSGAALTRQRWDFYFVGEGATDSQYDASRREIIEFFRETNEEDVGIIETTQAGRSSPGYAGGVFSSVWEPAVHQFQRLVLRYIS